MNLTQEYVRSLFDYRDGELYWKVVKGRRGKIGDIGGTVRDDGRRQIGINRKSYLIHRLIFLYHYGYLPEFLDHIDGNPLNNDINNLREATQQENNWNRKKSKVINGKPTSSEFKGVSWNKFDKKWLAQIYINNKGRYIGQYDSEIEAAKSYNKAAIELFGEFANLNKFNEVIL